MSEKEPLTPIERVAEMLHENITEQFGRKCDDFCGGCACCEVWAYLELVETVRIELGNTHVWKMRNAIGHLDRLEITTTTNSIEHLADALIRLRDWNPIGAEQDD